MAVCFSYDQQVYEVYPKQDKEIFLAIPATLDKEHIKRLEKLNVP
jgi:hypothetical protein